MNNFEYNDSILSLINVKKDFIRLDGSVLKAVDDISFHVRRGEVFGLLGPNGAGKTTTLRMISTVFHPTAGDIVVNGLSIRSHSKEIRKNLGFHSGGTGLYKRLTACEMVRYFGDLYGMSKNEITSRIDYLFELLELNDYRNVLCEKLSSGNRQKVSIARTLVHNPPILVFDEPTVGLDVIVAENLMKFIEHLKTEGKTIIFSTHIMEEAERICDNIALINHGQIFFSGTTSEIYEHSGAKNLKDSFFVLMERHNSQSTSMS